MYVIKHNGNVLYSPAAQSAAYRVLSPKLDMDINANGSCSFVMPPGCRMYDEIRRRKSIITVEQDGVEIFRGRVLDDETDKFKQRSVYSEGVRGYLNDSQAAPYTFTGTPRGLLEKLIIEHNKQVEPEKRFTIGRVTIDRRSETGTYENVAYWETFKEIDEKLLSAYGGYLRVRIDGGVMYLDWLKEYSAADAKEIRFGVNLVDLRDKNDAAEIFTILRPLGASVVEDGEFKEPINIKTVNDGLDYIEDEEAVAKYGRIWRTQTWPDVEDPHLLLQKGQEYMKIGMELRTITLNAIDMHFISGSAEAIRVGDKVHILSQPHGIDLEKVCCKIEIDLVNPENTLYTFGEPPKTLTDSTVKAEKELDSLTGYKGGGGGRGNVKEEMTGILRWAKIQVDQANANISLNAGEINSLTGRMSTAEIEIDGLNAQILLTAKQEEVDDICQKLTKAGIEVRGDIANIKLMASQEVVDDMGERVSAAEIEIDGLASEITLKADKVTIDAELTSIRKYFAGSATVAKMVVTNLTANSMTFDGLKCSWDYIEIPTSASMPGLSAHNVRLADGGSIMIYAFTSETRTVTLHTDGVTVMKAGT